MPIARRTIMVRTVPTNTPLQQQIDEFIAEGASWLPTNLLQDLLSPIGQLMNSGAAENALKERAQAPDFALPDARGNAVRLSHLLTQGPVIMTFYRGQWCPYCHLALRAAHKQVCADLPAFNGDNSWELPMAGTFLVDQSGTVRLAFVHPDFTRRLDPSVIIARLNELKGEREGSTA